MITSIKIANAMVEQLRAELAAAQAVIEQMREALHGLVKNDGVDAFYHLDKGIGTATVSGKCWLSAREALTLTPSLDALHESRAKSLEEAVANWPYKVGGHREEIEAKAAAHRARKQATKEEGK